MYEKYLEKLLTKYDKDLLFREFEDYLEKKYNSDFPELSIPVSVFCIELSPFESLVKYLKENMNLGYSKIGFLLKKDRRVVWITYKRATKKALQQFIVPEHSIYLPLTKLVSDKLSIAEIVVTYLKEDLKLRNSEISRLLKKDDRTVWTLYTRARKKKEAGTNG
jgi:hypothetical protein